MAPARIVGILLLLLPIASNVEGSEKSADLCRAAALLAAQETGVPVKVLQALTLVETGRNLSGKLQPWPWAVNVEGKGYWFQNRRIAVEFVTEKYRAGIRNFDVGCFQINHRWHGQSFTSIEQMFDPKANASYAANFLKDLYKEGGSWAWAAGAYHSRTVSLAASYRNRFKHILANLSDDVPAINPPHRAEPTPVEPTWGSLAGVLLAPSAPLLTPTAIALF